MAWVQKFYDMLSRMHVTMATPTLSNARKPYHQLSSCFIDTVPDSLEGIYRSIDNFAQVSKYGGGMGMYFGKVRAAGGSIRGFEGAAGGVVRWIRLVNDTAVAVDQLGMRQGAVAVYLDAWHKDLPEFLQLRTNNGDDRMKAHDVFPAVCYPDLFWKLAKEDIDAEWALLCPHEVLTVKGYACLLYTSLARHLLQQLGLDAEVQPAVFQPGDGKQIFHKLDEPHGVVVDIGIQALFFRLIQHARMLHQYARVARDAGERGSQVMGDGAQQVRPQLLLLGLQFRVRFFAGDALFFQRQRAFV